MGVVYRAEDTRLKRQVAIKFLPHHISASEEERRRFKIEARAAAALNHPNIATIYAIEEADDEMFIAMEYIDGQELKEMIRKISPGSPLEKEERGGFLPLDVVIDCALQIAEGLNAAHEKGILHRDIKSSNIMITGKGQVKIMDFGLAKVRGDVEITMAGTTLGTVAYMSPQQLLGEQVDEQSDIWAYGIVLYELLSSQLPFKGTYEQSVMYAITHDDPIPLLELRADIPPYLKNIVTKCLEKNPASRYQNFHQILSDLRNEALQPDQVSEVPVTGKSVTKRVSLTMGRRLSFLLAAFFLILVLVWMFVFSGWQDIRNGFSSKPTEQHLLVLPFTNVGGEARDRAFCDGLLETLTSKLTQLEQFHGSLWVVPASEVIRNKIESPG